MSDKKDSKLNNRSQLDTVTVWRYFALKHDKRFVTLQQKG